MKFNTLGARIGLGYALMAMVLAVAVLATLWQFDNVTRTSDRIGDLRAPTAYCSIAMLNSVNESNAALRGWTILGENSLKEQRHGLWSEEINPLLERMATLSENWTDPQNVVRLNGIRHRLGQLSRFQQQIEEIAHTPENEPAIKLLVEQVMPRVRTMSTAITTILAIEKVQETTGDRKRLLAAVGDLSAGTARMTSDLHAYLLTGDESTRHCFEKHWKTNAAQLAYLASHCRWLTIEQREALTRLQTTHRELGPLTSQALEIRGGPHWNQARWLLATKAIPTAEGSSVSSRRWRRANSF
jgi:methyl-accepting chemotaxis protein